MLDQVGNGVKRLVGELREVTNELRPPGLIRFGLTNAIRICADDFQKRHAQHSVKLSLAKAVNQVPENISLALYRIFPGEPGIILPAMPGQAEVSVKLIDRTGEVLMEIKDNGQGFRPAAFMGRIYPPGIVMAWC